MDTIRKEVIARIQVLRAIGMQYFQDALSLDPGDRWARKLYQKIDECDLFLAVLVTRGYEFRVGSERNQLLR